MPNAVSLASELNGVNGHGKGRAAALVQEATATGSRGGRGHSRNSSLSQAAPVKLPIPGPPRERLLPFVIR